MGRGLPMRRLVLLVACLAQAGCLWPSSRYQPHAPGRVAIMQKGPGIAYVRDGREYRHLTDAVADSPAALREART